MKKSPRWILVLAVALLALSAVVYFSTRSENNTKTAFLERYGLEGRSVEEIVYTLDSSRNDPAGLSSSITSKYLILQDNAGEVKLALPEDKFYLSFAPYVTNTHPCGTHSLISCQGELVNEEIQAVITDGEGNEIVNAAMTTMENGFVGVWLPRDMDATVTVLYEGMTAQAPITTYAGSDTCLTTPLQLN